MVHLIIKYLIVYWFDIVDVFLDALWKMLFVEGDIVTYRYALQ